MTALILNANALSIPLADKSVQCVVTSPPYYGLRDYGTAKWEGGDPECDHNPQRPDGGARADRSLPLGRGGMFREVCSKCGAIRIDEQLGLEPTPDEYVANMVAVFREVKRVLKDDGVLWLNIGDSYSGSGNGSGDYRDEGASISKNNNKYGTHKPGTPNGLKPKDLIGIPWMLAFALRADGWYLRQDIIWHKPNPMPESVKDRCTKSHEYIFLLSKSARYYYDNEAVKEDAAGGRERFGGAKYGDKGLDKSRNDTARFDETIVSVRNKRDVWTVTTKPYKGAHFATFPEKLVEPCILAGSKPGDTVFDPFLGSGTVAMVALRLGRNAIGTELNPEYCKLAQKRIQHIQPIINFEVKA